MREIKAGILIIILVESFARIFLGGGVGSYFPTTFTIVISILKIIFSLVGLVNLAKRNKLVRDVTYCVLGGLLTMNFSNQLLFLINYHSNELAGSTTIIFAYRIFIVFLIYKIWGLGE